MIVVHCDDFNLYIWFLNSTSTKEFLSNQCSKYLNRTERFKNNRKIRCSVIVITLLLFHGEIPLLCQLERIIKYLSFFIDWKY